MKRIGDVTGDALAVLREAREVAPARTAAELEAEVAAVRWVRDCATALGGRCPTLLYATDDEHLRTWARAVVDAAGTYEPGDLLAVLAQCRSGVGVPARVEIADLLGLLRGSRAARGRVARDDAALERVRGWRRTDGSAVRDAFRGLSWAKDLGLLDGAPMATVMERAASPDPGAALARTLGVERGAQVAALVRLAGQVRVALERVAEAERAAQARLEAAEDADERRAARRALDDARAEGQRTRQAIEARTEARCQAIAKGLTTW